MERRHADGLEFLAFEAAKAAFMFRVGLAARRKSKAPMLIMGQKGQIGRADDRYGYRLIDAVAPSIAL